MSKGIKLVSLADVIPAEILERVRKMERTDDGAYVLEYLNFKPDVARLLGLKSEDMAVRCCPVGAICRVIDPATEWRWPSANTVEAKHERLPDLLRIDYTIPTLVAVIKAFDQRREGVTRQEIKAGKLSSVDWTVKKVAAVYVQTSIV